MKVLLFHELDTFFKRNQLQNGKMVLQIINNIVGQHMIVLYHFIFLVGLVL